MCFVPSVDECKKQWKAVRDKFVKDLKAIEAATRSGAGASSVRVFEFFQQMSFYTDCGRPKKCAECS